MGPICRQRDCMYCTFTQVTLYKQEKTHTPNFCYVIHNYTWDIHVRLTKYFITAHFHELCEDTKVWNNLIQNLEHQDHLLL